MELVIGKAHIPVAMIHPVAMINQVIEAMIAGHRLVPPTCAGCTRFDGGTRMCTAGMNTVWTNPCIAHTEALRIESDPK